MGENSENGEGKAIGPGAAVAACKGGMGENLDNGEGKAIGPGAAGVAWRGGRGEDSHNEEAKELGPGRAMPALLEDRRGALSHTSLLYTSHAP